MQPKPITIHTIAAVVGQGGGAYTRRDIADALGRGKTTHLINTIEKAVRMGLIFKRAGYDAHWRDAWIYTSTDDQLEIPF